MSTKSGWKASSSARRRRNASTTTSRCARAAASPSSSPHSARIGFGQFSIARTSAGTDSRSRNPRRMSAMFSSGNWNMGAWDSPMPSRSPMMAPCCLRDACLSLRYHSSQTVGGVIHVGRVDHMAEVLLLLLGTYLQEVVLHDVQHLWIERAIRVKTRPGQAGVERRVLQARVLRENGNNLFTATV